MTTAPQFAKCKCRHCDGSIEFEREHAGESAECPHCGIETELFIPAEMPSTRAQLKVWKRRWLLPLAAVCGLGLIVAALNKLFNTQPEMVGQLFGGVLGAVVFLAAAFLVLLWAILWIIFPVFVYYGMRRMEKLLTQIERNTRKET